MSFERWVALAGALLLVVGLATAYVKRLPFSTSLVYLLLGVALGPRGFDVVAYDLGALGNASVWFEHATEMAIVVALFIGGLRLRLPPRHRAWHAAYRLAGPVMVATIAGVAVFARFALGFAWAPALLLGAVLAPTDPVLASAVSIDNASDHDRVKYALSGEAGLNDGAAFPFVVLALGLSERGAGSWLWQWGATKLVYATVVGLALGFLFGRAVAHLAIRLHTHHRQPDAPNDLLALALITLTYAAAEAVGAWGFLAVFAAGVGFRHAEAYIVRQSPHPDWQADGDEPAHKTVHPPAENLVGAHVESASLEAPAVAAGVIVAQTLSFGDTLERLFEMGLLVLVGVGLFSHWDWRGVAVAMALFFVLRPLATHVFLVGTDTTVRQRWLVGLFGIRGIGSLYYLSYAAAHHFPEEALGTVADVTLTVVAISVALHGIAATPALRLTAKK